MFLIKIVDLSKKIFTRISLNGRNEKGVKGMLPLRCLPLWGREGVTFLASRKKIR
jgi:hypothetical protein